ncbi:MAG: cadherin-like beta sandwich domain-containing protein [Paludibaculum sp.]
MRKLLLVGVACLCAGICALRAQGPAAVSGIELGADKTDIERLPIRLNEAFSPARLQYTATVEASYTASLFVTVKLSSSQPVSLKINGAESKGRRTGQGAAVPR